jgi:hypothetical protein
VVPLIVPLAPALYVSVYWLIANEAVTVRSAVIGPSVRDAVRHAVAQLTKWIAASGTAVTAVPLPPCATTCGVVPLIVPLAPALYVSVYWLIANEADTVKSAVMGPSVRDAVSTPSLQLTKW